MRNLKRALSLALASVMLLGMMVVGAGAAYSDEDKIANVEAAEVVSALGIMSGNTDGSFNPQGILKRGEFAVLLAQLMNGGKFNSALYKNANLFTDVTWAAGFVNYAASNGWISGYGDGKFGQEDEVTTAQALLIVCNALKIPVSFESGYQVGALAAAEEADILDGITDLAADKGMTRENAAQLILNAAKYTGETDKYIIREGNDVIKFDNLNDAMMYYKLVRTDNEPEPDTTTSLLKSKFGVDYLTSNQEDEYGRPAVAYKLNDKDETELIYAEKPDYVFTKATAEKTVYATIGKANVEKFESGAPSKTGTGTWTPTANGTVVELFVGEEDIEVVVIETGVSTIDTWVAADAEAETKEYVTVDGVDGTEYYTTDFTEDDADDDTVVYYTLNEDDELTAVVKAEKVAGVKVEKKIGSSSFVAGGKTYEYAAACAETATYHASTTWDLYLDKYGFVLKIEQAQAGDPDTVYAVIEATDTETALFGKPVNKAQITYTDGTKATLDVDDFTHYDSEVDDDIFYLVGLEYDEENKVYEIVDSADYYGGAAHEDGKIVKGTSKIGTGLYATDKTIFMVAKYNSSTSDLAGYDIYTGIKNVPSMDAVEFEYIIDDDTDTLAIVLVKVKTAAQSTTTESIFVLGNRTATKVQDANGTYYTLKAIVKGEITTIDVAASASDDLDETVSALVKSLTKNDKGIVTAYGDPVESVDGTGAVEAAKNGVVKFDDVAYAYAENAEVFEIDGQTITKKGIADIKSTKEGYECGFSLIIKDGAIATVYMTKAAVERT